MPKKNSCDQKKNIMLSWCPGDTAKAIELLEKALECELAPDQAAVRTSVHPPSDSFPSIHPPSHSIHDLQPGGMRIRGRLCAVACACA